MENFCEITFCQQIGSNKRHNQDALFNGEAVFQYKLKTAEKRLENRPHFIVGVADGISNSNRSEKASKLAMQLLSQMESISRQTIYELQSNLSAELAEDYFGSATTFMSAEIDQITQDHSILSELLDDFPDKKEEDFATIYGGVSSCLVADYSEFQDKIFYQEIEIKQGESLLLCSDGLTDGLSAEVREKIWKQYDNDKSRLTVCRKLIEKQIVYDDLSVIICTF